MSRTAGLDSHCQAHLQRIEQFLHRAIERLPNVPPSLRAAMLYTLFLPAAKRLRPLLAVLSCEALGGKIQRVLPTACALELIHTYSLIHDDLPSMDNDDFRRGKPSSHKKFGEALAILAGDALQTLAFELIATETKPTALAPALICEVAHAAGMQGMVGGQVLDLAQNHAPSLACRKKTYLHKTAALFMASTRTGALAAEATPSQLRAFTDFGKNLGLAFQFVDEVLDEKASARRKLKALNLKEAERFMQKAKRSIALLGARGKYLRQLCDAILAHAAANSSG